MFDYEAIDPSEVNDDTIPAGTYRAVVTRAVEKPLRGDKQGAYLELRLDILDQEDEMNPLWERLYLDHPNPKAVKMAKRKLAEIMTAIGKPRIKGSDDLLEVPMMINVTRKEDGYQDQPENNIKKFYAAEDVTVPSSGEPDW